MTYALALLTTHGEIHGESFSSLQNEITFSRTEDAIKNISNLFRHGHISDMVCAHCHMYHSVIILLAVKLCRTILYYRR